MCRKYHRYGNIEILDSAINELKFFLYIIKYLKENLSNKKRKGLRFIRVRRPLLLDFYYHINKKKHPANYYTIDVYYKLTKYENRVKTHSVPLTTF